MNLSHTNTRIDEIADGLYRISTDVPELMPGGFRFNQFLIVDDAPLLFHTGLPSLFDSVSSGHPLIRIAQGGRKSGRIWGWCPKTTESIGGDKPPRRQERHKSS